MMRSVCIGLLAFIIAETEPVMRITDISALR